jgi:hypothetical protein
LSAALAQVLVEVLGKVQPKPSALVVGNTDIDAKLTTNPATQRSVLADVMDAHLSPLLTSLLGPLPDGHGFSQAALDKLQSAAGSLPTAPFHGNSLPTSGFRFPDIKLRFFGRLNKKTKDWNFYHDIAAAATRLRSHMATPGTWDHPHSLSEARAQYLAFFALKAFYIRIIACSYAARFSSSTLAEAMALFMCEGEMVVPMPMWHLDGHLPALDEQFDFFYSPVERKPDLASTMAQGLWSKDLAAFRKEWGIPGKDILDPVLTRCALLAALLDWHLIVIGYDYLTARVFARANAKGGANPQRLVDELASFSVDIGMAGDSAEAVTVITGLLNSLSWHVMHDRIVVAPQDPVKLLTYVLTSGLCFMQKAGDAAVDGPFLAVPASLSYLAHNTSDRRHKTEALKDKYAWIMASAAVALSRKAVAPPYCAAAHAAIAALRPIPTLPDIPEFSSVGSDEHAALAGKVAAALKTPALQAEFAEFVVRAEADEWAGWTKHRANLARYLRTLRWYQALTS